MYENTNTEVKQIGKKPIKSTLRGMNVGDKEVFVYAQRESVKQSIHSLKYSEGMKFATHCDFFEVTKTA